MIVRPARVIAPSGQKSAQTAQPLHASLNAGRSSDHEPVWLRSESSVLTAKARTRGEPFAAPAASSSVSRTSVCCRVQRA